MTNREALSIILTIAGDMVVNGISEDINEWKFSVSTPKRDKKKVIKEVEKWNETQRQRAIRLKIAYDILSKAIRQE